MGVSLLYISEIAEVLGEPRSFDELLPAGRGARTLGDTVVDPSLRPDELFAQAESRELIVRGLRALRSRDLALAITLRFLCGWPRAQIAEVLGVDPRRINVFERAALNRMREALNERPK